LQSITTPASTTVYAQAHVVARRTGGASGTAEDGAAYDCTVCVKNVGGTATIIGSAASTVIGESQGGWSAFFDVSTNQIRLRVNGAADNNVTWHATLRLWQVSS
jgi:hypothetical protein